MLSAAENDLLCRVGAGAPMGELFRRYWLPALRSIDLPEPDCAPLRVRLLGEDLVAFRDTDGHVGLLGENCSHRRASLFYGRNEECGLRCIYHGWKYDVQGNIVDTPAEPAASMLKHHVKHPAYPCQERNGLVYTYMGPKEDLPSLPNLPWLTAPADHVQVGGVIINDCNWLQMQEANVDSVHTPFLHARSGRSGGDAYGGPSQRWRNQNNPPIFDTESMNGGIRAITRYPAEDGASFIRINTFILPVYTAVPNGEYVDGKLDGFTVNIEVPTDDYTTTRYSVQVQRANPISRPVRDFRPDEVAPNGRKLKNLANDYLIDREKQRTREVFSGLDASFPIQDACAVESMGPITDRAQEHLGVTDTHVTAVRKFLLDTLQRFQDGDEPPGLSADRVNDEFHDLYVVQGVVPAGQHWTAALPELTTYEVAAASSVAG